MDRMEKEIEKIVFLMEIKKKKHVFSKEILPSHKKRMDDISNTIYKDYDPKKFMNLSFPEGDDIKKEIEDLKSIEVDKEKVEKLDEVQVSFEKLLKKNGIKAPSDMMSELIKKSGSVILKLKYHYNRPRPFQWAKENGVELNGVDLESSQSPSFPSGHAGQAVITALVLSELYPELEEKLKDLAQEISYSRNMAKVHYPSDTKVGKEVARDMFEYLKESGELNKLFKKYGVKKNTKK